MTRSFGLAASLVIATASSTVFAQDWPQWRGPNRDGHAAGFEAPASWPTELKKVWQVKVGDGVATPALVGDRLYVYAWEEGEAIASCRNAATGEEIWRWKHESAARRGGDAGFPGPRSSPAVADGKVVLLSVYGAVACLDAEKGTLLWRNAEFENEIPRFATSSSPIVVNDLAVVQLGGDSGGVLIAYDLATGKERWRYAGEGPGYASPALMTIDGAQAIVVPTDRSMIAVNAADGKLLWQTDYVQGRYNAASPVIDGSELIYAGPTRGLTAVKLAGDADALAATESWKSPDATVQFNTPVKRGDLIFGLSNAGSVFCVDAKTGEMKWSQSITEEAASSGDRPAEGSGERGPGQGGERPGGPRPGGSEERPGDRPREGGEGAPNPPGDRPAQGAGEGQPGQPGGDRGPGRFGPGGPGGPGGRGPGGGFGGGFGGGRRGGGGGRGGYGSIVDAGDALFALTPAGKLIVFEPSAEGFKQLASYQVAQQGAYAYPIVSGKRIFVKDQNDLTLWTLE